MGVSEHHGISEHRCHVMGTDAHIVVHGGDRSTLDRAVERLVSLEARWSRFRPESELSRLNAEAATAVVVSSDTARLVATAVAAWSLTGGRFDPTTGPALIAAGYDRSFELLPVTDATGIGAAVAVWFFFNFTTMSIDFLYMQMPGRLVIMNMGYQLISYLIAGAILGLMPAKGAKAAP